MILKGIWLEAEINIAYYLKMAAEMKSKMSDHSTLWK
jgi:hypothetical protein